MMQFQFIFYPPVDIRLITTGSLDKAVLITGDSGKLELVVNENNMATSTRLQTRYKVEAKLKVEIDGDRLRIHIPVESIPQSARPYWSVEKAAFEWKVIVGLSVPPLEPIPTNVPDIFYLPEIYSIRYSKIRSEYAEFPVMWNVRRASGEPKK